MKKKVLAIAFALVLFVQIPVTSQVSAATTDSQQTDYSDVKPLTAQQQKVDDPEYQRAMGKANADFYNTSEEESVLGMQNTTSPFTGGGYNHDSRFDKNTIVNGIDVSSYQNSIDWNAVKASGVNFAFIRVGGRGASSGQLYSDANFKNNIQSALAAGVQVGVYMFSQAISTDEAVDEANYVINQIAGYSIALPVVMDFEYSGGAAGRLQAANLSKDTATAVCNAFANRVWAGGYTPMIYANKTMLSNAVNAASINAMIWLAQYNMQTSYTGEYQYWQYSSNGTVPGISGRVDCDFWYQGATTSAKNPNTSSSSSSSAASNTAKANPTTENVINSNVDQVTDASARFYNKDGSLVKNSFYCDGTYTYYMQADGSPMVNKLTWDPEGKGLIYFDGKGHMKFDSFQYCKDVGYTCYFGSTGRAVFDQVIFYKNNAYYCGATGNIEHSGWFRFANNLDIGYANTNGTLLTNGFSYDQWGRTVFFHWNGMLARGLITDGVYYYNMDTTDGHYLGQFK